MKKLSLAAATAVVAIATAVSGPAFAAGHDDMFVIRTTDKTPDQAVEAIKAYSDSKKWQWMGSDKVKKGEVIIAKTCIPAVGAKLWPLGLQVSAMLPCGNFGVYVKDGKTNISMLNPGYMNMLYPDPKVEEAVKVAQPLLTGLLDSVAK
jgi:hypothetical protein